MMPPDRRNEERITRTQVGDERMPKGFGIAWIRVEIGCQWIDHARWRAGQRAIERADIQVAHLPGRKQREAAPSGDDAGKISRAVIMRRGLGSVADPQPGCRAPERQVERIGRGPSRQMLVRGCGVGIEDVPLALRYGGESEKFAEEQLQRRLLAVEIEPLQVVAAIKEAPTELRAADQHVQRSARIAEPDQIPGDRLVAGSPRRYARPVPDLPAQNQRRRSGGDFARERRRIDAVALLDTGAGLSTKARAGGATDPVLHNHRLPTPKPGANGSRSERC